METKYQIHGSSVSIIKLNEDTVLNDLPPHIYTLQLHPLEGYYLEIVKDQLQLPDKIYGNTHDRVYKIIETYNSRDTSTGIILTGDKGTGKTLLVSLLANVLVAEQKLPVILIRQAYGGQPFTSFIELLGECCLVFDEFGKMYRDSRHEEGVQQEELLSLFDGIDKSKRMIILTENSEYDISEFMFNRPSRMYYHFKYKKLDEGSIKGYCSDYDVSSETITDLIELSRLSRIFSFDMLKAIVEEHLRFPTLTVEDLIVDLNIDVRKELGVEIEITNVVSKATKESVKVFGSNIVNKPESRHSYTHLKLVAEQTVDYAQSGSKLAQSLDSVEVEAEDEKSKEIYFELSDLVYESAGKLVYETSEYTIAAKEVPQQYTSYIKYF